MTESNPGTVKPFFSYFHKFENSLALLGILLLALYPVMEVVARLFKTAMPYSNPYIHHLVLFVTFIGAMITSRKGEHLSLSMALNLKEPLKGRLQVATMTLSAMMVTMFSWSALAFLFNGFEPGKKIGIFPIAVVGIVMVAGYAVMAVRFVTSLPRQGMNRRIGSLGMVLGTLLALEPVSQTVMALWENAPGFFESMMTFSQNLLGWVSVPLIFLLLAAAIFGAPIFVVLGGIGYLLITNAGDPGMTVPDAAYQMLTGHSIPAIPLFTVAGFLLSESKAGERLVSFFRTFVSWIPGGLAILAVLVCSFFTTFTGASGVTILALGALLSFVLEKGKYKRKFNVGLLTASGSVGLLFPPSLPIIIYGVIAGVSIKEMFMGGILPGVVMVLAMVIFGVVYALRNKVEREPFNFKEAGNYLLEVAGLLVLVGLAYLLGIKTLAASQGIETLALVEIIVVAYALIVSGIRKSPIGEVLLPVVIILAYFGGVTNLVESAAIAVVYLFILEVFIHKDLKIKDLPGVISKCIPIIGGVLIILSMANALNSHIVLAEIPMKLTEWVQANIGSKYVFLLLLNILLLLTGCLMDIFSAIMVVVPLIIPLGQLFGIHPVHLGIIFLANMELGYMTPPVGLNLFLASYRFKEPMSKLYRDVLPFLLIQLAAVLLITYIPFLSTFLVNLFK